MYIKVVYILIQANQSTYAALGFVSWVLIQSIYPPSLQGGEERIDRLGEERALNVLFCEFVCFLLMCLTCSYIPVILGQE